MHSSSTRPDRWAGAVGAGERCLRVILLCQEGYTSSPAADMLVRLGIDRSTDIIGGFAAWQNAGLPCRELRPEPERWQTRIRPVE